MLVWTRQIFNIKMTFCGPNFVAWQIARLARGVGLRKLKWRCETKCTDVMTALLWADLPPKNKEQQKLLRCGESEPLMRRLKLFWLEGWLFKLVNQFVYRAHPCHSPWWAERTISGSVWIQIIHQLEILDNYKIPLPSHPIKHPAAGR